MEQPLTAGTIKLLAILVLGVGSFVSGGVPLYLNGRRRPSLGAGRSSSLLITLLLCFGAGVLLATALVHMLADVQAGLPRYAEVVFCGGYFLVYAIEELVLLWTERRRGGGGGAEVRDIVALKNLHPDTKAPSLEKSVPPVEAIEPPAPQATGTFSLLLALCVHSLLEGLAIGVQSTAPRVLLLLGAISAHKFVVAFCLGIEICSQQQNNTRSNWAQLSIFSLGSVAGIALGMALDGLDETFQRLVMPALQGVAGGTLLYVTVSEVLPRERSRGHGGAAADAMTGIWQFLAVAVGFAVMATLSVMISEG